MVRVTPLCDQTVLLVFLIQAAGSTMAQNLKFGQAKTLNSPAPRRFFSRPNANPSDPHGKLQFLLRGNSKSAVKAAAESENSVSTNPLFGNQTGTPSLGNKTVPLGEGTQSFPPGIDQTVVQRIEQDNQDISTIATNLADVQQAFRELERDAWSEAFDLGSVQRFLRKHKDETQANEQLKMKKEELIRNMRKITSEFEEAKDKLALQKIEHGRENLTLNQKLKAKDKTLKEATTNLEGLRRLNNSNEEHKTSNVELREKNVEVLKDVRSVLEDLDQERLKLEEKKKTTKRLEESVEEQKNYTRGCRENAALVGKAIAASEEARELAKKQAEKVKMSAEEVYSKELSEIREMKIRNAKAVANKVTIQSQIVTTKEHLAALQSHGEIQVEKMLNDLSNLRQKAASLENDLMSAVQGRKALENEIQSIQATMAELERQLMNGELAALNANNTRLKSELKMVQEHMQKSEQNGDFAAAKFKHNGALLAHVKRQVQDLTTEVANVGRNTVAQEETIKQATEDLEAKADKQTLITESVQTNDCNTFWDERHPEVLQELEACKAYDSDLESANAQIGSLSSLANTVRTSSQVMQDQPTETSTE